MALKLKVVSIDGDVVRVAADGDVVVAGTPAESVNPLAGLLGARWWAQKVIVDFSGTTYIDSAGIGWLIGSAKQFRKDGGVMVLHSLSPRVRQMLDMLKIGLMVPIAANAAAAVEIATKPAAQGDK